MISALASWVLRVYPPTWRLRYEEEVRALLADNPPGLRDLAGLLRMAVVERARVIGDPVEHPVLAGVPTYFGGWITAGLVMALSANGVATMLSRNLDEAPEWAGVAGIIGVVATFVRALLAQPPAFSGIPLRIAGRRVRSGPLTPVESRTWWAVLWCSVALGMWARIYPIKGAEWLPPLWFNCVFFLRMTSRAAWVRAESFRTIRRLRGEFCDAIREHQRISRLMLLGLATVAEADAVLRDIDRLNREVRSAARVYRGAHLPHLPADRPLGL